MVAFVLGCFGIAATALGIALLTGSWHHARGRRGGAECVLSGQDSCDSDAGAFRVSMFSLGDFLCAAFWLLTLGSTPFLWHASFLMLVRFLRNAWRKRIQMALICFDIKRYVLPFWSRKSIVEIGPTYPKKVPGKNIHPFGAGNVYVY